jgi:RNA polymerase sigma-70 factor (ECF subfamily)
MNKEPVKEDFLNPMQDNGGIMFKICNSYCPNKNEKEDLAREIIYHLWKSGLSFNTDHEFSMCMYRVALNVVISFYPKRKTRPRYFYDGTSHKGRR